MRFICTCIIILFHRAAALGASPLWNLEFLEKVSGSVIRRIMIADINCKYSGRQELRKANCELFFSIDKCPNVTFHVKPY
jgi:hypothetical protein